ncbi:carboxymuconolactone decarboxylase family protein [Nocardioides sp.]|uniref:carboxymuconolactone decarboxylase family protein n=1 Tax=Nocardioides sp. TaxID=35761 RepID=UPI0027332CF6|nr:carboxymuconolactone decarboxylase family protein [Nocardioides sp.]MDP3894743.1 carboxymuconolactone decarboxylase family protein [Nocardioides sp.]
MGSPTADQLTAARRSAARVPLVEPARGLGRVVTWYSRRAYGDVLDNALALLHHRPVLTAVFGFERRVARWQRLDAGLKTLAVMSSASVIGCSWCLDFGYYAAHSEGLDTDKVREVPRWRESEVFTPTERRVMEYAEAMTLTPPAVTDELAATLREELGNEAFVELTMMVAVENQRSRFNSALGLTSQGFRDRWELVP